MFNLHYSTQLETLADRFAERLSARDPARLLVPETVLVPQAGLETWLKQHVASRHGIAANIEFLRPAAFVWRLLQAARPGLPRQSLFERETLRWRLFGLLRDEQGDALRRFQLASHHARLFEQYQGYRRELLDAWQGGAEPEDTQARLWRALVKGAPDEAPRNRLIGDYLRDYADAPPPGLPPRLLAFGCINISPDVLAVLRLVARHAELDFFLPTPCQAYWGDVQSRREARAAGRDLFDTPDNPLLVSLGGVGREFVSGLFANDDVQGDDVEEYEPPRDSLLHRVQADIVELLPPSRPSRDGKRDAEDRSIQLHVCHSPLREVEVLHDRLLDLLQRDPTLEPRDIAVLVPNVATYAPYVDAVFGSLAPDDARHLPWSVSDRASDATHAITSAFLALLDLPASRLRLDEVLELLAVPALARRADLSGADLDELRDSARAAGIVWGEDEHDRVAHGLPAYREYSWAFGRERVLLGYLRGDDGASELACGIAPIGTIEGDRIEAFGQLLRLQRLLRELARFQRETHAARDWQERLNLTLSALLPERLEDDEQRALEGIRAALAALTGHVAAANCDEPLDWQCVRAFLREGLAEAPARQRFLGGGVNVCGMVPLRDVPFRVICVLGLDAESFPRRDPADVLNRIDADALAGQRRRGDRSRREDDRYLFLQTLMAARDVLYLSYTGIDMRDGSSREPSVLVTELLDVVCEGYCVDAGAARAAMTTVHPMRPFSPRLFDGEQAQLFTYRHEWRAAATPGSIAPLRFADIDWPLGDAGPRVAFDDLARWLAAPQETFLRRQVDLRIDEIEEDGSGREPVSDDPLRRAIRERRMVDGLLANASLRGEALRRELDAGAVLPPLALGDQPFETSWQTVAPQLAVWQQRMGGALRPAAPFALALPSGRVLEGALALYPQGHADWIGGLSNGARWLRWWLGALVARVQDEQMPCLAFGRGDKDLSLPLAPAVPAGDAARAVLDQLLKEYDSARQRPLPLLKYSGWAFARKLATHKGKGDAQVAALKAARDQWEGNGDFGAGDSFAESSERWVAQAFDGVALFDDAEARDEFVRVTETVYLPIWHAIVQGGRA